MSIYGEIPIDWIETQLGNISLFITDGSHFSPKPQVSGYYMCSVKDMTYSSFLFNQAKLISKEDFEILVKQGCSPQEDDLLISKDGANCLDLLFLYTQKEKIVLLSSIAIVRLNETVDKKFIRYFLLSPDCQFLMRNNFVSGSAIPRVVLKDFKQIPILTPPLPEQKAIAGVLSSLDDKIDLLHRQNKTLETMAETLFRQWFIEEAQDDWEEKTLGNFFVMGSGKAIPKHTSNSNINYVVLGANGSIGRTSQFLFCEKLIYTGRVGTLGNVRIVDNQPVWLSDNTLVFRNILYFYFIYFQLKQINFHEYNVGSTQPLIRQKDIKEINIKFPTDTKKISNFENYSQILFQKIKSNTYQIQTLEKLRDTLLPRLMRGEIRVQYDNTAS